MSYDISYRRRVFKMTAAQAGHYDDVFFLLEEAGSNNLYECDNRRRVRRWECLATGAYWQCLSAVTICAAACCGGSLCLNGRRDTTPESYIRAWRKALAAAVAYTDAINHGFQLRLYVRISDAEALDSRRRDFETLSAQALVPAHRCQDRSDAECTEWYFDAVPDQIKLWLATKTNGRGFHSVKVTAIN
jgi:hypothetical protein